MIDVQLCTPTTCIGSPGRDFTSQVNERLRASENARRLPQIQAALVCEPSARWAGSKDLDLDLTADRSRKLVHEGRLKYVKPQVRRCSVIIAMCVFPDPGSVASGARFS